MAKKKFKNWLFCGGLTPQEYKQIIPMLRDENLKIWRVMSPILCVIFMTILVLTFICPDYFIIDDAEIVIENAVLKYQIVYSVLTTFSVITTFLFWVVAMKRPKITMFAVVISEIVLLAVFASVAPTLARNTLSVTLIYCVILFASATLTLLNSFCSYMLIGNSQILFMVLTCLFVKNWDILIDDIVYSNVFAVLSLVIGNYFRNSRMQSINLRYYVQQQCYIDSLTGAKSKIAYDKRVQEFIERFMQNAECEPFAVVVFDVNGLKLTNDTYGHEIGDELLIHSVELIGDFFANSEIYRTGGDEFVAILTGVDYENRNEIVKKFRLRIADVHKNSKSLLEDIPIACGMSAYDPENDFDYISVFSRADTIMYDDKRRIKQKNEYLKSYKRD